MIYGRSGKGDESWHQEGTAAACDRPNDVYVSEELLDEGEENSTRGFLFGYFKNLELALKQVQYTISHSCIAGQLQIKPQGVVGGTGQEESGTGEGWVGRTAW